MPPKRDTQSQPSDQSEAASSALESMITALTASVDALTTRITTLEEKSTPFQSNLQVPSPQLTPHPNQSMLAQPITSPPAESDKRWRPDDIGEFDGTGDVQAFVDRIRSVASLKGYRLVQTNLVTLLKGVAFNWYHYELSDHTKDLSLNAASSIEPWCLALIARFKQSHSELISQLEASRYTRRDASNKKDATAYIQDVMRLAKGLGWSQQDGLMTAFHHFEPSLQQTLDQPSNLNAFIQQIQLRQQGWFQIYANFGSSKPQPPRPPSYLPARSPQQQSYRPSYPPNRPTYPNQSNQLRQITDKGPPPQPRAYWAEQEEDYGDYTYDAPSDAWIAVPEHGPGHTPRRWGNTHDVGGQEAMANWTAAGDDHRCTQQGCTHYH